jgi:hypothetical protein
MLFPDNVCAGRGGHHLPMMGRPRLRVGSNECADEGRRLTPAMRHATSGGPARSRTGVDGRQRQSPGHHGPRRERNLYRMETRRDRGWLQNEPGAGDAKDAMGIDGLPFRGVGQRWSGILMTAKFEADPISAAGRIGGKPRPGHREDEAMQEQGMNQ